jgi:hypothetical protein
MTPEILKKKIEKIVRCELDVHSNDREHAIRDIIDRIAKLFEETRKGSEE